jgi:ArsR family transcriptional regulator, cadmium/lead-responsive transcriptional repressor
MDLRADHSLDTLARIGRALSEENRCRILLQLLDGPCYPTDLAQGLGLSKGNTSNHLTCLRECGLVAAEQEGRRVRYELADAALADGLRALLQASLVVEDPECRR